MRETPPILETPRLRLREFLPADVDGLAQVLSDPIAMQYYPTPYDKQGVDDWIERNRGRYKKDGHGLWAMILKTSGELIGDCGLALQKIEGVGEIEIGYHVRRDLWGQGLATEAATACRDFGFERFKARRLISIVRPENLPSRRVAEKVGMTVWKEIQWADLRHLVYAIERKSLNV